MRKYNVVFGYVDKTCYSCFVWEHSQREAVKAANKKVSTGVACDSIKVASVGYRSKGGIRP